MKVSYPKFPENIPIRIVHQDVDDGLLSPIKTTAEVSLATKLDDYFLRLSQSRAYATGIVVQLMTGARVQVEFPEFIERIELMNPSDTISAEQAMALMEDFLAGAEQRKKKSLQKTRKINLRDNS